VGVGGLHTAGFKEMYLLGYEALDIPEDIFL
jgi:hypothetical protein